MDARRVTEPPPAEEVNLRKSVSQLARVRVSAILRQLRSAHGYTYAQVQERTGLPQQLLYDVEYRERRLTLLELTALAECYEVSASDVLGIDLDP
ncbi:MAG: helix-turn-helix transcriptional regulator [Anaerolineales bacterium]|nr:helix-turn-helix transcriptional regulator [Anaerolineales bacterium]